MLRVYIRPLYIFNSFSAGIDLWRQKLTSEIDQNLTSKVGPRAVCRRFICKQGHLIEIDRSTFVWIQILLMNVSNFYRLEFVSRASDSQIRVGKNLNCTMWRFKRLCVKITPFSNHGVNSMFQLIVVKIMSNISTHQRTSVPSKQDTLTQCWVNVGPSPPMRTCWIWPVSGIDDPDARHPSPPPPPTSRTRCNAIVCDQTSAAKSII